MVRNTQLKRGTKNKTEPIAYTNEIGSFLNSGKFAYVGDGNLMLNQGRMSPGGDGNVFTTEVSGNYEQDSNGAYGTDLDLWWTGDTDIPSKEADRINVACGKRHGRPRRHRRPHAVQQRQRPARRPRGCHPLRGQRRQRRDPDQSEPGCAAVGGGHLRAALSERESISCSATTSISRLTGLNPNQTSFGEQINEIQLTFPRPTADPGADPNTPLAPLVAALYDLPDVAALQDAYDQLTPGIYVENELATIISNLDFHNSLHSCGARDGKFRFARQENCVWARYNHRELDRDRTFDNIGFQETTEGFSAGGQAKLDDIWVAGVGFSYEKSTLATDTMSWSEGDRYQGGIVAKGIFGGTVVAAALTGGYADYETIRSMSFLNFTDIAYGDQEIGFGSAHVRAGHAFENGNFYLRPAVDAGITHYVVSSFEETGSTIAGMSVKGIQQTFYTVEPTLEVGAEFRAGETLFRPFLRAGLMQFLGDELPQIAATLQLAPSGVGSSVIEDDFDKTFAELAGGVDILMAGNLALRVDGSWMKSDDVEVYGASGKVQLRF